MYYSDLGEVKLKTVKQLLLYQKTAATTQKKTREKKEHFQNDDL